MSDAGAVLHASRCAQALLAFHFPGWKAREPLPERLRVWMAGAMQTPFLTRGFVSEPLRLERVGRMLSVCLLVAEHEKILLLDQVRARADAADRGAETLRVLGMTERECEVLRWLSEGKSNPEIGIILSIALRTVKKHLEHIFEKLDVENRTCAAVRAREVLRGGGPWRDS